MSSFLGRMKEYSTISIDRFDRENLHARAYFLSHCHKDHMKGLKGPLLRRKLKFSRTVRLYCSFVTKELLLSNPKYAFWEDRIVPLELESPTQISLVDEASGEKDDLLVTLLTAGHCPGSVMFLFEGAQGTVLYTGDFRFATGDASRIELLHSGSRVKDIQTIYLDSTFYDPRFYQIPSREACLSGIRDLISTWISQSVYHVVWLNCKAAYGYEYLFTNLGDTFYTQIHVKSLAMFKKMPEILSHVTEDRNTQIHACRHPKDEEYLRGNRLPCGSVAPDGTPYRIISIKPSTMWFGDRSKMSNVVVKTGSSSYRACFSFHSSYVEIKDFLSYLQPINIHPSVIPIGRSLTDVTEMLKPMCRQQSERAAFVYKPLGVVLKRTRMEQPAYDSDGDEGLFEGPDLAPVRKKMSLSQDVKKDVKEHTPVRTAAPPAAVEVITANSRSSVGNFMDCTESNDDDDDDDEEEEGEEPFLIKGEHGTKEKEEEEQTTETNGGEEERDEGEERENEKNSSEMDDDGKEVGVSPSPAPTPRWEEFFTAETLTDSQNSLSQSCGSVASPSPSKMTGSQTPELFSDDGEEGEALLEIKGEQETKEEEEEEEWKACGSHTSHSPSRMSGSQTPDLFSEDEKDDLADKDKASSDQDAPVTAALVDQSEQRLGREQGELAAYDGPRQREEEIGSQSVQSEEELSASQASSDFDIPCTPESQAPPIEELAKIYRKLASGEEVVVRKGSQGST